MKKMQTFGWLTGGVALLLAGSGQAAPGVTLDEVLSRVLAAHPRVHVSAAGVAAREGAALQAGLRPNPEVSLEVEELGAAGGGDALETTLALAQPVELGGKREKRQRAAFLEVELARWDQAAARQDLLAESRTAFFEALAAQERLVQARSLADLADQGRRQDLRLPRGAGDADPHRRARRARRLRK